MTETSSPSDEHDEAKRLLETIPYELLAAELARRNSARRKTAGGGRPKVMCVCPRCAQQFGTRELARHRAVCRG